MSDNPTKDYKDAVRARLPIGMDYNDGVSRYQLNNHSFFTYKTADWYDTYVRKFGYTSQYGILGKEADLAFDFGNNKYYTERQKSTFSSAITHSRASTATMVDSDGVLKWGPHNLLARNTLSGATVGVVGNGGSLPIGWEISSSVDQIEVLEVSTYNGDPAIRVRLDFDNTSGGTTSRALRRTFSEFISVVEGVRYTTEVNVNIISNNSQAVTLLHVESNNSGTFVAASAQNIAGTGWQFVSLVDDVMAATVAQLRPYFVSFNIPAGLVFSADFWVSAPRTYRSDLGGMVNNPDRGDSYVPTTSTARYLPRRGHHVYNGSAWVNEGLLHESEQRTNLLHTTNALVTQSLTVTAVPHTLHFTGTGTVTLSGASTAGPLVGTGTGEQNRVHLTFTPTAASLTLTVTGTVTNAQLEVGPTPSSYIPNLAASGSVTRAADIMTIPAANLPWPTPEYIGPELVTNGTFDTDVSGWTDSSSAGGSISWNASGYLDLNATTATSRAGQDVAVTAGSVYAVSVTVVDLGGSGASALYLDGASSSNINFVTSGVGTHTIYYVAPDSNMNISVRNFSTGTTVSVDNISIREINPLAVSIQMDGRVTYADEDVFTNVMLWRWQVDANNSLRTSIDTVGTTGNVVFRSASAGVQDFPTGTIEYNPGVFVPVNIASRHGSTFINGAVDGTALTANTTPVALPDLSSTDLSLGYDYMGTIRTFRIWADDIGDAGLVEATL